MSELDGLEEIDLTAHGAARSSKRIRNAIKQLHNANERAKKNWKTALRRYQTRKAKVEK